MTSLICLLFSMPFTVRCLALARRATWRSAMRTRRRILSMALESGGTRPHSDQSGRPAAKVRLRMVSNSVSRREGYVRMAGSKLVCLEDGRDLEKLQVPQMFIGPTVHRLDQGMANCLRPAAGRWQTPTARPARPLLRLGSSRPCTVYLRTKKFRTHASPRPIHAPRAAAICINRMLQD